MLGLGLGLNRGGALKPVPLQIPDCLVWLAADRGVVTVNGDEVDTWANSGALGGFYSDVATERPSQKLNIQNGLPGILFNPDDDSLNDKHMVLDYAPRNPTGFSLITCGREIGTPSSTYAATLVSMESGHKSFYQFMITNTERSPKTGVFYDDTTSVAVYPSIPPNNLQVATPFWMVSGFDGSAQKIYAWTDLNDVNQSTFTHPIYHVNADSGMSLGDYGGYGWYGYLFEVLFYDRYLTTAEFAKIAAYLEAKWNFTNTIYAK